MSHTPGPWNYSANLSASENHKGWRISPAIVRQRDGRPIAWDVSPLLAFDGAEPHSEAEANARLIAAAPDLLAALKDLAVSHEGLVNSGDCGNWQVLDEPEMRTANAAIAKAEGK